MLRNGLTLFVLALVVLAPVSFAQPAQPLLPPPNIDVQAVRFSRATAEGQQWPWLQIEVELNSRGRDSRAPGNSRYVDNVRVDFMMSYEAERGEARSFVFYRSSATIVSLDTGRSMVRFYLPWEIVRRDGLNFQEPQFWMVTLTAGDQELELGNRARSNRFENPQMIRSFRQRVAADGAANDGILVPQFDSPFAMQNLRDTPSFVRRPAR
jgi:hypothetical protein